MGRRAYRPAGDPQNHPELHRHLLNSLPNFGGEVSGDALVASAAG
jgi:hypothetical protein